MNSPQVVGILVCYYECYYKKAKMEFCRLIKSVSGDFRVVIVNNNSSQLLSNEDDEDRVHFIDGDNNGWEFSGWDRGVEYVEEVFQPSGNVIVILANDTFCHHRPYGFLERSLFSRAFKRLRQSRLLVGEANRFKEPFELEGVEITTWISSFLFGLQYSTLNKVSPLDKMGGEFKGTSIIQNSTVHLPGASSNLSSHLTSWLFPQGNSGWYNSKINNEEVKALKLKSILNEKHLTRSVLKIGEGVFNIYSEPTLFKLKMFRLRSYIKINKFKLIVGKVTGVFLSFKER